MIVRDSGTRRIASLHGPCPRSLPRRRTMPDDPKVWHQRRCRLATPCPHLAGDEHHEHLHLHGAALVSAPGLLSLPRTAGRGSRRGKEVAVLVLYGAAASSRPRARQTSIAPVSPWKYSASSDLLYVPISTRKSTSKLACRQLPRWPAPRGEDLLTHGAARHRGPGAGMLSCTYPGEDRSSPSWPFSYMLLFRTKTYLCFAFALEPLTLKPEPSARAFRPGHARRPR